MDRDDKRMHIAASFPCKNLKMFISKSTGLKAKASHELFKGCTIKGNGF